MRKHIWAACGFSIVAVVACAATVPLRPGGGNRPPPELIECTQGSGDSETHTFTPDRADSMELHGHKLIVPERAVSAPTEITLRELPTPLIKLRLQANGRERFTFANGRAAILVVSYARCPNRDAISQQQTAVYRLRSNDLPDATPINNTPLPSTPYPTFWQTRASLRGLSGYGVGRVADGGQ